MGKLYFSINSFHFVPQNGHIFAHFEKKKKENLGFFFHVYKTRLGNTWCECCYFVGKLSKRFPLKNTNTTICM